MNTQARSFPNVIFVLLSKILIEIFLLFYFQVGSQVAHPGIDNDFDDEKAKKYYTYYQWVCFVLFFQVTCVFNQKF